MGAVTASPWKPAPSARLINLQRTLGPVARQAPSAPDCHNPTRYGPSRISPYWQQRYWHIAINVTGILATTPVLYGQQRYCCMGNNSSVILATVVLAYGQQHYWHISNNSSAIPATGILHYRHTRVSQYQPMRLDA